MSQEELVALLAEGVDRNSLQPCTVSPAVASPSSRRAWIEITACASWTSTALVALLAEGVDRNWRARSFALMMQSRPPRGGRG